MIRLTLILVSFGTAAILSLLGAAILAVLIGTQSTWLTIVFWIGLFLPLYRWMRGK